MYTCTHARHPAQGSEPASRPVVRTRQFHQLGTKDVAPYALAIIFLAVLLVDLYEFAVVRGHRRFTFGVSPVCCNLSDMSWLINICSLLQQSANPLVAAWPGTHL